MSRSLKVCSKYKYQSKSVANRNKATCKVINEIKSKYPNEGETEPINKQ